MLQAVGGKFDYGALTWRQLAQRILDPRGHLRGIGESFRARSIPGKRVYPSFLVLVLAEIDNTRGALCLGKPSLRGVDSDFVQPRRELRFPAESADAAPRREDRILYRLFAVRRVTQILAKKPTQ